MKILDNKAVWILLLCSFLIQNNSFAQTDGENDIRTITTSVPFLLIPPDATSGGMGDVGVSSIPNANSMHHNAAKFAFLEQSLGVTISYSPWLKGLVNDINLNYISGYKKLDKNQTIAFSLRYFTMGNITFTNEIGEEIGQFKPNEFAIDGSYARKLGDNISGAVSLRYIYSNLTGAFYAGGAETKPGMAVASDVSVYYQKDVDLGDIDGQFAFGANVSNIGNKISYTDDIIRDFIPINLRFGPRLTLYLDDYNTLSLMFDINKLMVPTPPIYARDSSGQAIPDGNGSYEIESGKDPNRSVVSGMFGSFTDAPFGLKEELREIYYSFGAEYWYDKQFALRTGFFYEHPTKGNRKFMTLGAGLKYNVFRLDFSYLVPIGDQRNPLENTLRFTLYFDFDAFKNQDEQPIN